MSLTEAERNLLQAEQDAEDFLRTGLVYKRRIEDALDYLDGLVKAGYSRHVGDIGALHAILAGGDPDEHATQDDTAGARSDENHRGVAPEGSDAPNAAERHTRDALDAIKEACTLARADAGTVWALTAIAHALLAQEKPQPPRPTFARGGVIPAGTPLPPPANGHTYTASEVATHGKAFLDAINSATEDPRP